MSPSNYLVYVIDDVPEIVDLACRMLYAAGGFDCRCYTSTEKLLEEFLPQQVDCVLSDLKMPRDGAELQRQIAILDPLLSFVFISGHADVKTAVRLMEQGALTLVEKPFTSKELISAVTKGAERTRQLRNRQSDRLAAAARLGTLSTEEREVLECMVSGLPNKSIAHNLSLSSRTVDRRRQNILQKMQVESVPELVAIVTRLRDEAN